MKQNKNEKSLPDLLFLEKRSVSTISGNNPNFSKN